MEKVVYQLKASGDSLLGTPFTMRSRMVFISRQAAENHIAEFWNKCCDEQQLYCAYPETLVVVIIELLLVE